MKVAVYYESYEHYKHTPSFCFPSNVSYLFSLYILITRNVVWMNEVNKIDQLVNSLMCMQVFSYVTMLHSASTC